MGHLTAAELAEAQEMCALYKAAEKAALNGKSYSIGNRTLTREDLNEIRLGRQEWCGKAAEGSASAQIGVRRIVPRDN